MKVSKKEYLCANLLMVNLLSAEKISKSFQHGRILLNQVSLGIAQGEKLALVGANGVGKSTFLKILAGELECDSGTIAFRSGVKVSYLSQEHPVPPGMVVKDLIFHPDHEISSTVRDYELMMLHPEAHEPEALQQVLERMDELNAWHYETRVHEVLGKLGIEDLESKVENLSGGQKKRVFLAKLILAEPDIMILDEPTNHLDIEAIEWLENYLSGQQITLIMVSHDRYFLDKISTSILELDRGELFVYQGSYANFLEQKAAREEMQRTEVERARNLLRKELEWIRRQPKARGTKSKYRVEAFHVLKEKASREIKKDKLELGILEKRQGGKILEITHLMKNFGTFKVVDDFSYIFKRQDRIGIVGKNGVGKTTFLDLLCKKVSPDGGELDFGQTTSIGYFTQDTVNSLNNENRVIEEVLEIAEFIKLADGTQVSASKFLDQFLFPPEKQYTYISKLSGGEKKRLQLLKILVANPNFLIFDEPTNDFDLDTLNVLEDFLEKFSGCLLLVSHDRYFVDRLVDQLFVFEGDGKISIFNGNYSDYRLMVEERKKIEEKNRDTVKKVQEKIPAKNLKKLNYKEQVELETLAKEIEKLELEKAQVMDLLSATAIQHDDLLRWSEEFRQIENKIDEKTVRWMELEERK